MRPLQQQQHTPRSTAMRLRDPINTYKCFESIATLSPIPIKCTDSIGIGDTRTVSNLHRSTSLDSLANSSEQGSSSDDIGQLSDVDSINEFDSSTQTHADVHRKSDLDERKLREVEGKVTDNQGPIIKAYLEKAHRKCDYQNCAFKEKDNAEHIDDGEHQVNCGSVSSVTSVTSGLVPKSRRQSVASSGSVGRMETIIEEPIEPKISVKEILARFETLNSLEVSICNIELLRSIILQLVDPFLSNTKQHNSIHCTHSVIWRQIK